MASKERAAVQSGLNDILGSVIQSDQRSAGRTQKDTFKATDPDTIDTVSEISTLETNNEHDNKTLGHYDNKISKQKDKQTSDISEAQADSDRPTRRRKEPPVAALASLLDRRTEEAATMAQAATMTVTLRIPAPLNEWLDEYVHRSWPKKVRKQELVIEALQLLFVRRGRPGEEILETIIPPEKRA